MDFRVTYFLPKVNPLLPDLNQLIIIIIRNLFYGNPWIKIGFPVKPIKTTYKRGKDVKEIMSPSTVPLVKYLVVGFIYNKR